MSFGPLFQALLEHIGASKRPSRPQFEPRRRESLRLGSNRSPKRYLLGHYGTLCWNTDSILGTGGPQFEPRRKEPYVWVQIAASKRPSRPQLNPDVRNLHVWLQIEAPRGIFRPLWHTQTLYWGVKPRPYVAKQVVRTDFGHENSPL